MSEEYQAPARGKLAALRALTSVPVSRPRSADTAALLAASIVTALHLALGGRYDLFRDELYFIVCGQHPALGYVDQPPAVPLLAASLYRLGLGAQGLRIPTALAAGALVWLAMRFARSLGGDRWAQALAGLACAIAPMLMGLTATLNTWRSIRSHGPPSPGCWSGRTARVTIAR